MNPYKRIQITVIPAGLDIIMSDDDKVLVAKERKVAEMGPELVTAMEAIQTLLSINKPEAALLMANSVLSLVNN